MNEQDRPPDRPTDFHSLQAEPDYDVTESARAEREARRVDTDFHTLKKQLPQSDRRYQFRTITDFLIDALTPIMIFIMAECVIFFLLDIRFIYTEVDDIRLRIVGFCLILGVVALNRLIAREGSDESILYIIALIGVTGLFTLALSIEGKSIARGFLANPWAETFVNMAIVALIWWSTNRLVHECCVDENRTAGDVGILTGTVRTLQQKIRRVPTDTRPASSRKRGGVFETMEIEAVDPLDWEDPARMKSEAAKVAAPITRMRRHPGMSIFYYSIPAFLIFALGLPVLMQGGGKYILHGHLYVGGFTVAALSLLMLTSLGGLREYFRSRRVRLPAGIGPFWIGLGSLMIAIVMFGATALPLPAMPRMAYVEEHETDFWTRGSTFELQGTELTPEEMIRQNEIVNTVGQIVLVSLVLFGLFAALRGLGSFAAVMGRYRDRLPRILVRFFDWLDAALQRVVRVPRLVRRPGRHVRVDAAIALSSAYRNPMKGEGPGSGVAVRDYVTQAYDALCALAQDLGVPRERDQTPYEFIQSFPRIMNSIRDEAREITELYVQSAYSPIALDEKVLDRLRRFWLAFETLRNRYVR